MQQLLDGFVLLFVLALVEKVFAVAHNMLDYMVHLL